MNIRLLLSVAGGLSLPVLLAASLAGCGGPSASTETPSVPRAAAPAHDSVQASLTAPAPDATATSTPTVPDTAVAPAAKPAPTPKPASPVPSALPKPGAAVPASPSPVAAALLPSAEPATPATRTQTGRVLDEAGQPLVGATVLLKGTAKGTSTDGNGYYSLDVPSGENTLLVGYGGYEDETAITRTSQPLNVTLLPRASNTAQAGQRERQ